MVGAGQGVREGGRTDVADLVSDDHDPVLGQSGVGRGAAQEQGVGLVGDQQIDVREPQAVAVQGVTEDFREDPQNEVPYDPPVHVHLVPALGDGLRRGGQSATAGRDEDVARTGAVRAEPNRSEAGAGWHGPKDRRSRSVGEQHGRGAVGRVDETGVDLDADHGCVPFAGAGAEPVAGDPGGEQPAGTGRRHVEGDRVVRTHQGLDPARGRRSEFVGGGGGEDEQTERGSGQTRRGERLPHGFGGEIGGRLLRCRDVPAQHPGALHDPVGIHTGRLGDLVVRQDAFG